MSKVILVSQSFPPVGGSHATRTLALAGLLSKKYDLCGVTINVGAAYPNRNDSQSLNMQVERVFPGIFHNIAHSGSKKTDTISETESTDSLRNALKNIIRPATALYRRLEIVDSYFDWIPHLAWHIRQKTKVNDIIISMSMPNSSHVGVLIGLIGKKNRWIVDFADPWTLDKTSKKNYIRRMIENVLENRILARADAIYFVTDSTLSDYKTRYPAYSSKMHIARMGHEENPERHSSYEKNTVFYGGTLPTENRNADNLLCLIRKMDNIQFIFSGPCIDTVKAYFNYDLPSNVRIISWLSHYEYIDMLRNSEVAVIFGNSNYQQIPGKVLQCIGFANKILYISNMDRQNDESVVILEEFSQASVSDNSSNEIYHCLINLLKEDKVTHNYTNNLEWRYTLSPILTSVAQFIDEDV